MNSICTVPLFLLLLCPNLKVMTSAICLTVHLSYKTNKKEPKQLVSAVDTVGSPLFTQSLHHRPAVTQGQFLSRVFLLLNWLLYQS